MFQVRQPDQADKGDRDPHDVPADLFAERPLRADEAVFLPQLSPCARIVRIIDPEGKQYVVYLLFDRLDASENVAVGRVATIRQRWARAVLRIAEICHGFTVISSSLRRVYQLEPDLLVRRHVRLDDHVLCNHVAICLLFQQHDYIIPAD